MSSIKLTGDTSGEITISAPAVAGTNTLTLPASTGSLMTSTFTGDINFDSGTLVVDSTNNRVGIGTSSPTAKFNVESTGDTGMIMTKTGQSSWLIQTLDSGVFRLYSNTASAERMRIDSSGTVLVGTSSLGSNVADFYVSGYIGSEGTRGRQGINGTSNGNRMNTWWTGSALQAWVDNTNVGNFSISSDYRIKRNIETQTQPALDRIAQLRPVTYQSADFGSLFKASDEIKEGFIAHELAEIIPSAVEGEKDAEDQVQSLKLDALCSVMVKAIQEQQETIKALETRITALENN